MVQLRQTSHRIIENILVKDHVLSCMLYRTPTGRLWVGSSIQHSAGGKSVLILWAHFISQFVFFLTLSILSTLYFYFYLSCHLTFMKKISEIWWHFPVVLPLLFWKTQDFICLIYGLTSKNSLISYNISPQMKYHPAFWLAFWATRVTSETV